MSLLSKLQPKDGSTHYKKRVGRGIGSGLGGTSAKGHKGQLARAGGKVRRGFEGGQTPLSRRLPKFGFSNAAFATVYTEINLSMLNKFTGVVDYNLLLEAKLIQRGDLIKVLGNGKLDKALVVKANAFSKNAIIEIQKAGGTAEVIS